MIFDGWVACGPGFDFLLGIWRGKYDHTVAIDAVIPHSLIESLPRKNR